MKYFGSLLLLALLGGCASNQAPALPTPSAQAPRVAINRPVPLAGVLAARPASWLVLQSDRNVANMLTRWGKDAGWRVLWDGAPEILITGNTKVERGDFLAAADLVITEARSKGYPLKAKAFSDNVLVIKTEN
jgi:hypothetical protein